MMIVPGGSALEKFTVVRGTGDDDPPPNSSLNPPGMRPRGAPPVRISSSRSVLALALASGTANATAATTSAATPRRPIIKPRPKNCSDRYAKAVPGERQATNYARQQPT